MFPIIKYKVRIEKIKFLHKRKTTAIGKSHEKSGKKQAIFFCTPVSKFQKISTLSICDGAKQIYPKKQKKILRKNTVRISEAVVGKYSVKKVSLKISPPV